MQVRFGWTGILKRQSRLLRAALFVGWLTDQDSNLDRQNQNLQCYRYTIGQNSSNSGAKVIKKWNSGNFFSSPVRGHPQSFATFFLSWKVS